MRKNRANINRRDQCIIIQTRVQFCTISRGKLFCSFRRREVEKETSGGEERKVKERKETAEEGRM